MSYRKRRNKLKRHDRHDEHDPGVAHQAKLDRLALERGMRRLAQQKYETRQAIARRLAARDRTEANARRIAAGRQPDYRGLTPDQLPTSGPGIDRRCDPAGTCPKRQNPDGHTWQSGCWCYRAAGGAT